jgi:hypothetical protein
MNAWTGKGIILAILVSALPYDGLTWTAGAIVASLAGTFGLYQEIEDRKRDKK